MTLTIGVDVGGTKIAAGVVDEDGQIVARARRESPARDADAIENAVADMVGELSRNREVGGVGVAAAGFIDASRSTVLFAPNLAWRNEPLKAELESRTGLPTVIENDANAAAWGEFRFGGGADVEDMLMVTVGTGIGGGIVMGAMLQRGASGIAAEIGHMRVVPNGRPCPCGNNGCWEQYASGSALVRDARELAKTDRRAAALLERADGRPEAITGPLITDAAKAGDGFAVERLAELGRWLGEGIASLAAVLDPAVVVIGGGVSEAGELLLVPVLQHYEANLTGRGHRPVLEVRSAELGNDAGLVGAADLARR